jgi:molecular chaperone DnaJ
MSKNFYDVLGVEKKATQDDIKKAFRKLAQKHHPDKGGNADEFKKITEAYSVLSDERKRREYDSYGQTFNGQAGAGGFGAGGFDFSQYGGGSPFGDVDLGDIFGDLFGGGGGRRRTKRGRDISIDVEISFKESAFGVKRSVLLNKTSSCIACKGTGAKNATEFDTCKTCNGQGKIHETRNSIMGAFTSVRECTACDGSGKTPKVKCPTCHGHAVSTKQEEISIHIPAGIDSGEMIRMPGAGEAVKGGVAGDLYVKVHVKPHDVFKKEGIHLTMDLPLKLTDALLGTVVSVKTIDDKNIEVKVPAMTKTEEYLRVRGKGIVVDGSVTGDLLIKVSVAMPKKLSTKAKKALEALKEEGI